MTSRAKDQVKEKRGTSPAVPRQGDPTQRRRSPSPAAVTPDAKNASVSTSTEVPNYLKPTVASKLDPSAKPSLKKQPSGDKPVIQLSRKKSLDKPPSPSRAPKPISGTNSPKSSEKSLKSSSKTSPFPKSNLEKQSKATKVVGKQSSLQQSRTSNVRKSVATNSKKLNNGSSTTKAPKRNTSPTAVINSSKPEAQEKDQESSLSEAEEINDKKLPTENLSLDQEDKEHENVINEEALEEEEELKVCDSSTVTGEQNAPLPVDLEVTQAETPTEENGNNNYQETEEQHKEELSESHHHQEKTGLVGEVEDDGEKKEMGEEIASINVPKEDFSEVKEEVGESKEAPKSEEITQVERVGKGSKPEETENVLKKGQGPSPQGKKDTAAYNDVIEETATKLREQRRNKVRALVGAFETVISLESDE